MKLANEWPVSWERWQEIQGHKKPAPKRPTPKPSADDLEHALKLAAMRDRGGLCPAPPGQEEMLER